MATTDTTKRTTKRVSETLTGGPKQHPDHAKHVSSSAASPSTPAARGRKSPEDDVMNSTITGRDDQRPGINPEPERKGNIYDPEHPDTRQSPTLDGSQDAR